MTRDKTTLIIIHCSATKAELYVNAEIIDRWHRGRGWSGIGYHEVIKRDGTIELGRDLSAKGAHAKGYNSVSVGICMVGGLDKDGNPEDNFTGAQFKALEETLLHKMRIYPKARIIAHNEVNSHKACPCFGVKDWLRHNGLHQDKEI